MQESISKTISDATEEARPNPVHGSRRGLGAMIGGTSLWIIGAIFFALTKEPLWLVFMPFSGIIVGFLFAPLIFDRA